ncbi:hypothetical protein, partial [Sphingobacterium faecium]|uniref:hypothetical protein n=1 Tax=Sphingobacterium faecium TaxID=34087 RepID=UPI00320B81F9
MYQDQTLLSILIKATNHKRKIVKRKRNHSTKRRRGVNVKINTNSALRKDDQIQNHGDIGKGDCGALASLRQQ